jgi:hypothetical protein
MVTNGPQQHRENNLSCSLYTTENSTESKSREPLLNAVAIENVSHLGRSTLSCEVLKTKDLSQDDGETKILIVVPEHADVTIGSLNLDSAQSGVFLTITKNSSTSENQSQALFGNELGAPLSRPPDNSDSIVVRFLARPIAYIFLRSNADDWLQEIKQLRVDLSIHENYTERQLLVMELFWTLDLIRGSIIRKRSGILEKMID